MLEDRRLALDDLAEKLKGVCRRDSMHSNSSNNLQFQILSARYVPKILNAEHEARRRDLGSMRRYKSSSFGRVNSSGKMAVT